MDDLLWSGRLEIGDRSAVWYGAVGSGQMHRHFAAQAALAPDDLSTINTAGDVTRGRCLLIDPLARHSLGPAANATLIYVEPFGPIDPAISSLLELSGASDAPVLTSAPDRQSFWKRWQAHLPSPTAETDRRIAGVLAWLDAALAEGAVPLDRASASAGLSPDRFRHLFREQVGTPYRRYVLWRRLRLAAAELVAGTTVTTAAHAAGFADAAHLSRTLRAMFGVTASQVLRVG